MIDKRWKLLPAILIAVIAVFAIGFQISKSRTFQFFGQIIPRVNTQHKVVALTFDDGPTEGRTDEVITVLAGEGVKATFFVIGSELEKHPAEGGKLAAAGHEIGNHTYSHDRMVFKSPSFIKSEIERTDELIGKTGYSGEILFRPPFCKKLLGLPYYLSKHSRKTITWDVEPDSYPEIAKDSNKIIDYVLKNTRPGSIILLHVMYENGQESFKAVKGIISGLKGQGYQFKTVSELIAVSNQS